MIKRVLVVSMVGLSLVGCVNNDTLSGDVYTASEAKQVQNVSYGTIVNVRPVQIQGGDDSNVIGAIGGCGGNLGVSLGNQVVVCVTGLHVHDVVGVAQLIHILNQNDFHCLSSSLIISCNRLRRAGWRDDGRA